jgi:hypothetical protein
LALTFHGPTSSAKIIMMLGFLSAAWAGVSAPKSAAPAASRDKPQVSIFGFMFSRLDLLFLFSVRGAVSLSQGRTNCLGFCFVV